MSGLAEDLKKDLQKEANMIPIWVHVDSVKVLVLGVSIFLEPGNVLYLASK